MTESADSYEHRTDRRPPPDQEGAAARATEVAGRIVGIQHRLGFDPRSGDEGAQAWSPEHLASPLPDGPEGPAAETTRGGGPPVVVKPNVPPSGPPNRWTKGWGEGRFLQALRRRGSPITSELDG